jgi:hypothetical protein
MPSNKYKQMVAEEQPNEATETNSETNPQNTEVTPPPNQDDLLLNLILELGDRYLPLASKVGQFLSDKFLAEVDKAFVNSTLNTVATNSLVDSESLIKQARERLNLLDYQVTNRRQLVGIVNHNEVDVSNA